MIDQIVRLAQFQLAVLVQGNVLLCSRALNNTMRCSLLLYDLLVQQVETRTQYKFYTEMGNLNKNRTCAQINQFCGFFLTKSLVIQLSGAAAKFML